VGGDQMFALFTQSKQTYDVVVADAEYVVKLHAAQRIAALNRSDYSFDNYLEPFKRFPLSWIDGALYAIPVRWGSNGIVYNTNHLTARDVASYKILWDPKVKGKVGIWDWYLPSMGVLSKALGNADSYSLSDRQFGTLKSRLFELRPNVAAFHPNVPAMLSALANDQTWIVPAGAEWVAAALRVQGKPIDWTIPEEGGIMWTETLVLANDAPHPDTAKQYIQWMQSPETQASLAQREAGICDVPNKLAYDLMPPALRNSLKVHNAPEAEALIRKLSIRQLPASPPEATWQATWQDFKAK